jgi:phytanoyl-CoA hydroxylase
VPPSLLCDDALTRYRTEGWTVVPQVFSPAECEDIIEHVEAAAFRLDLGRPEDGQMVYRPMMHLADRALRDVACDPRWADIVIPAVGPDARLYWEQSVSKPPGAGTELPWHQDNGYTPLIPEEYLTCWLALDDADPANGGMQLLPGSHRQGTVRHWDDKEKNPYFRVGYDGDDPGVEVSVRRGDVLVFSSLVMHRSGPNHSDRQRRAWIIQYCPAHAASALSGRVLDDRLQVAEAGQWLDEPRRDRDFDLDAVLANYKTDRR